MPWPGGFFNIPVDTPGWISGDCHPQPLIPFGRFYLSGHGSFHPQLTMILSEGWHDEVNAEICTDSLAGTNVSSLSCGAVKAGAEVPQWERTRNGT